MEKLGKIKFLEEVVCQSKILILGRTSKLFLLTYCFRNILSKANRNFKILNLLSPISVILLLILRGTQLSAEVKQPLGSRVRL